MKKFNLKLQYNFNALLHKQILKNYQTTLATKPSLALLDTSSLIPSKAPHPWFVAGFVDAEGCFRIKIVPLKALKTGWRVQAVFQIGLHQKDQILLESIKLFLGVGNITNKGKDAIQFAVSAPKDLKVIIDHFDKYPLITQKRADFELFKQVVDLVSRKEHLTLSGLHKIVAIKASLNNGLSPELKAAFPNIIPVPRPLVQLPTFTCINPSWLAGFTSGGRRRLFLY